MGEMLGLIFVSGQALAKNYWETLWGGEEL